jgi:5-methylcytosine-specific restriction endonuclease McrA
MQSAMKSAESKNGELGKRGPTTRRSRTANGNERLRRDDLMAILKRQQERCALTGRSLKPAYAAIDHIVPLIKGGKHVAANLQILHMQVNVAKGSMAQDEFIALCREVVAHADCQAQGA